MLRIYGIVLVIDTNVNVPMYCSVFSLLAHHVLYIASIVFI